MGLSRATYLGPFVEYRVRLERRVVSTRSRPLRLRETVVEEPAGDVRELFDNVDALADGTTTEATDHRMRRLIPNDRRSEHIGGIYLSEGDHAAEVDPTKIAAGLAAFTAAYAPELKIVRAKYGPSNVAVRCGLLQWQS